MRTLCSLSVEETGTLIVNLGFPEIAAAISAEPRLALAGVDLPFVRGKHLLSYGIHAAPRRLRFAKQMGGFATAGVPPSMVGAKRAWSAELVADVKRAATQAVTLARAEFAERAELHVLGLHVEMSGEELLAATTIAWTGKGIGNNIQHVQGLAWLLARSVNLTSLAFTQDAFGEDKEGMSNLACGLAGNTTLVKLNLCSCQIGQLGVAALAQALPSMTQLMELSLFHNSIDDVGAAVLAKALPSMTQLTRLNLSLNDFGDAGAAALAAALPFMEGLTLLNLEHHKATLKGEALLTAAKGPKLTLLMKQL